MALTVDGELIRVDGAQTDGEVNDAAINHGGQDGSGQLSDNLAEEVGTHRVHVIVHLTQEDRTFIWEDQDDVLDRVEGDGHGHEEEGTVAVLDSLNRAITVLEEDNSEDGRDDSDNELNIGGLREAYGVQEVSAEEQTQLIPPRDLILLHIRASNGLNFWVNGLDVVLKS